MSIDVRHIRDLYFSKYINFWYNIQKLGSMYVMFTWDQGLAGALMRRRNNECHFCRSCSAKWAASASTRNTTHSSILRVVFCPFGRSSTSLSLSVSTAPSPRNTAGINVTAHVYYDKMSCLPSFIHILAS